MFEFFANLFDGRFMPHGHCYQWLPELLWIHVLGDGLIALSYLVIPVLLWRFTRRRTDLGFKWVFVLFGLFILLCGMTHLLEIWTVWHGTYRLTGLVKLLTAAVSVATAITLYRMMPEALRVPSPNALASAQRLLAGEIQERHRVEQELADKKQMTLFHVVVEGSAGGMILVGRDGVIALANSSATTMFGYEDGGMVGLPLERLLPPEIRGQHSRLMTAFFDNPSRRSMGANRELEGLTRSGRFVPVEIALNPLEWQGELYVLASVVDISERKRQHKLLAEAKARFDRAVSGTADGLWEWQPESNEVWMSDQFFRVLGYNPEREQASFAFWEDRLHPEDKSRVLRDLYRHLAEGTPYSVEYRLRNGNGNYRWYLGRGDTFKDEHERVYVSGSLTDTTRRKETENELAEKTGFLDSIYQGIAHGVFVIDVTEDRDFRYAAFNPAEEKLTGIPFEEIAGGRPEDLAPRYIPEEAAQTIRQNYQRCLDAGDMVQYVEMIPIMGRETWWSTSLNPLFDPTGRICRIIGSASEISALKQMETSLRASEEYGRKILNHSYNGLYIYDLRESRNTYINPAYTRITGYAQHELDAVDLEQLFHPDDRERIHDHLHQVVDMQEEGSLRVEYRFRHRDGHWIWCLSNDAVFTRNEDGRPVEMIGTFIDITTLKTYGERLEESNRELEQFAFVASHDLREPLRKVKAFGELIVDRFSGDLPEKGRDYLRRMVGAASRLDLMISDLLAFSRVSRQLQVSRVALAHVLELVVEDLSQSIKESGGRIHVEALPEIEGDANHFYQLFLNLLSNALKYRRPDVTPEIRVGAETVDGCLQVFVEDNGIGLPEDQLEEIFKIFKRLHGRGAYSGSGIGLAVCRKIMERHGGKIRAENRAAADGSRFVLAFPASLKGGM